MRFLRFLARDRAVRKADRLARHGRAPEALSILEKELERSPGAPDLVAQRAWLLCDLGRPDEALAAIDAGLAAVPDHAVLQMIRGEALLKKRDYEGARSALTRSLELAGENIRTEYLLGLAYVALGETEKASRYFESSVRYDRHLVESRLLAMAERYLFEKNAS
jgi:tetratricopeptide (TPR) repeat protein